MSRSFTILLLAFLASASIAWGQSSAPRDTLHQPGGDRASAGIADSAPANEKTAVRSATPNKATNFDADPLLRVLVTKGVLTTDEARAIVSGGKLGEQRDRLA